MSDTSSPLLSIIVPTIGRPTLERALRSLLWQEGHALAWEAVIVGDSYREGGGGDFRAALDGVPARLAALDGGRTDRLRYVEHDGGVHAWGQPQRNHGATVARGRWLAWLGDDDLYLRGAFEAMGAVLASAEPIPHLFRWISPWKAVYWHTRGYVGEAPGHIDAECIVTPNDPDRLGTWTNRYQGDWDFIVETIRRYGGQTAWCDPIIAQAQPSPLDDWTLHHEHEHPPLPTAPAVPSSYTDELGLFEYTEYTAQRDAEAAEREAAHA